LPIDLNYLPYSIYLSVKRRRQHTQDCSIAIPISRAIVPTAHLHSEAASIRQPLPTPSDQTGPYSKSIDTMATQRRIISTEKTYLDRDEKPRETSVAPAVPSYGAHATDPCPYNQSTPSPYLACIRALADKFELLQSRHRQAARLHIRHDHVPARVVLLDSQQCLWR